MRQYDQVDYNCCSLLDMTEEVEKGDAAYGSSKVENLRWGVRRKPY